MRLRKALSVVLAAVGVAASLVVIAPPAAADPPYPNPLPDFAHPDRPHYPEYQPTNGRTSRPLVVIAVQFSGEQWPQAKNDEWLRARFFGPAATNVRGYFLAQSRDQANFWPAAETSGTAGDGVVRVNVGSRAEFFRLSEDEMYRRIVANADPFIDYRRFDLNSDRRVTTRELAIVPMLQEPPGATGTGCGATRRVGDGGDLDGVSLNGQLAAIVDSHSNLETIYHEIMHASFGMGRDWYSYGIDGYDVMQTTCQGGDFQVATGSWHAMHLGWSAPIVVTRDGYQDIPRWDSRPLGRAFLLYDPAKGTDNYFLLEHRRRAAGGYDADAGDNGLNIWRVNESVYHQDPRTGRLPISRIRPCGEPRACAPERYFDAWDPTDPTTPQRETNLRWEDGTASRLAIRAVNEPTRDFQRVYVDVPGPGALVDCFDRTGPAHRKAATLRAGQPGALVLPVQNTSESAGAVITSLQGLGDTIFTRVDLAAKQRIDAALPVHVPANTAPGRYTVVARATWANDQRYGSYCYATIDVQPAQGVWGYVYSPQPQPGTSTPPAEYQRNSTGRPNTVERTGVGEYRVRFGGLGTAGGTAHAVAYHRDTAGASCVIGGWTPESPLVSGPADLIVAVRCFDGAGRLTDSGFDAGFTAPLTADRFAYVWADQPDASSYTPHRPYQFNSTSAVNTVTRSGIGKYTVRMPGLGGAGGGTVAVTAYGWDPAVCRTDGWYSDGTTVSVTVSCTRGGAPADNRFTVTFADRTSLLGGTGPMAYAWSQDQSSPSSIPDPYYQHSSTGRQLTATRWSTGYYSVQLPGLGLEPGRRGWAHVTPYGGDARCKVDGLYPDSQGQRVFVWCHNMAGQPVDSLFTMSYLS